MLKMVIDWIIVVIVLQIAKFVVIQIRVQLVMLDIIWHNGKRGTKRTANAMINFAKYRTKAGFERLKKSFQKDLKQSKRYGNFKTRRNEYLLLLSSANG